jgi:signal transduction histidine kinase/CheY-like chemotaxis protein/HPt (histidine-containing phosphotransfer) domain-containing protein
MSWENNVWEERFKRERKARKESEALLEQKSMELWSANQLLEKQVEERTESLKKAMMEAENANNAKSIFLANMSHEIRTPLNAIIGFAKILSESDELNNKDAKHASIIYTSAESLLGIINNILDISKIESGNFDISLSKCSLYKLGEDVVELFSHKAAEKNIKFIYNIDYSLPSCVIADPNRLRQVLSNLIGNAIKFTPEHGHITVDIKLLSSEDDKALVRFEVSDSGIGIPKEKLGSIFDPFSQVENTYSKSYEGTGLGLCISSHLINSMGSDIAVESELEKGSTFSYELHFEICEDEQKSVHISSAKYNFLVDNIDAQIYKDAWNYLEIFGVVLDDADIEKGLRPDILIVTDTKNAASLKSLYKDTPAIYLFDNAIEAAKEHIQRDEASIGLPFFGSKFNDAIQSVMSCKLGLNKSTSKQSQDPKGAKILIAEDNSANQDLIQYFFDQTDYSYTIANNGIEAFDLAKNNRYDLILMDVNMPLLDGIEATKKIRSYEDENKLQRTPVVALTANALQGDKEKLLSEGMDDYLSKPIDFDALLATIENYLERKSNNAGEKISLDAQKISSLLKISDKMANIFIQHFKNDALKDLSELKAAIDTEDDEQITQKAHYIKNTCLNIAFDEAVDILNTLEREKLSSAQKLDLYYELEKLFKDAID